MWFEGTHSDIGGGYDETGLSDTTLLWMVREAHDAGLIFDAPLLSHYVNSGSDPIRHDPLTLGFRVHNAFVKMKMKMTKDTQSLAFTEGLRRLGNERALSVRIASSAVNHYQSGGYEPANVVELARATNGFTGIAESVTALPERDVDLGQFAKP